MNFVLITLALTCFVCVHSATWGYDDTGKWGVNFPACSGSKQSPVDIKPSETTYNKQLGSFKLINYDSQMNYDLTNNGHTVQATPSKMIMTATGGGFPGTFKVLQFHFHWSDTDTKKGSEHTVDNNPYPLEVHIVHINTAYADAKEAFKHADGLAVFGFFFKVGASNKALAKLKDILPTFPTNKSSTMLSLTDIFDTADLTKYYRYEGSLTTPPCAEAVIWTVFQNVLTATEAEIDAFRKVRGENKQTMTNFRPIQQLNGRKIYASAGSSGTMITAFSVLVFFSVFMVTNLW